MPLICSDFATYENIYLKTLLFFKIAFLKLLILSFWSFPVEASMKNSLSLFRLVLYLDIKKSKATL